MAANPEEDFVLKTIKSRDVHFVRFWFTDVLGRMKSFAVIPSELEDAFAKFHANHGTGKPTAILMATTKGKGVSYMENQAGWHGKAPNDQEYEQAMGELKAQLAEVEGM